MCNFIRVKVLGIYFMRIGFWISGEIFVAVEYCANGDMQNYLRAHREKFKNQLQRDILVVETPYPYRCDFYASK